MMQKWRYGLLFPLVLAAVLGGLSAWLDRISEVTVEEVALNPKEPQYSMAGIAGRRFDNEGLLREQLDAEAAWQLPKSTEVVFRRPEMKMYHQGVKIYQINGNEARYDTETRQALFERQVVLHKEAGDGRPAGKLTAERITVDTVKKTAVSDRPVQFSYGLSHGSAGGFSYNEEQGLLLLPSRVKATIYDPKNPS